MKKFIVIVSLVFVSALLRIQAAPQDLPRQILGVHLNMTKDEVHKRLQEIGTFVRDERKQQEIWQIRDASFSHLIIGFREDEKLRFVTAVAREDKEAKRVEYSRIGNLKQARQAGDVKIKNFNYEWNLAAEKSSPPMLVMARGRTPNS